jgi:serine protease Do
MYSVRADIVGREQAYHNSSCIAVDMYNDLALLRVNDAGDHPIAHLTDTTPSPGDEVHIVGMPAGTWWTYAHGYVSGHMPDYTNNNSDPHDMLQVSAAVYFGNSGGPAFNAAGELIGTTDSFKKNVPDIALFTCHDTLRGFLEHNKIISPLPAR